MNETIICAVGNVATQPVYRELTTGPSARFRLAVTSRYLDRGKNEWTDGHTNFFTVWANRQLATNAAGSLNVGDPVVVQGRLKVRSDVREGQSWTSADIDATAIGHDLARHVGLPARPQAGDGSQGLSRRLRICIWIRIRAVRTRARVGDATRRRGIPKGRLPTGGLSTGPGASSGDVTSVT